MHASTNPILITVVAAIAAGVLLIALARRAGLPSIVLLLAGGVALGPYGLSFVEPDRLGDGLRVLVSLLVGIILFEGGLTLDVAGYRKAPRLIVRLLTVGVICTWAGIALAVWLIADLPLPLAVVSASLLIVTGPTVVGPLLKRIKVTERVHHVLQWEGVLIDPIGVFIAITALELFALGMGTTAFVGLAVRVVSGLAIGFVGGLLLHLALDREIIPRDMAGVSSLATALSLFGMSEMVSPETGLLSVTVAGLTVGWRRPKGLPSIRHFKQEVTELSIGMVFILLSARLDLRQFLDFGWAGIAIVAAVVFLVRPFAVLTSTAGLRVPWRERALLSWIAPRGIVAATMASLLALELERLGAPRPRFVETLTYAVIVATIVLQGSTAGWLARVLGLVRQRPGGWLIVGAHRFGRGIAQFLTARGVGPVLLVDTNRGHVRQAKAEGLSAVVADARDTELLSQRPELASIGQLLAVTSNEELNTLACRSWLDTFGAEHCHRWQSMPESEGADDEGGAVWTTLPSPSALAVELEHGVAQLVSAADEGQPHHGLFVVRDGSAELTVAGSAHEPLADPGDRLLLVRQLDELGASLRGDLAFEIDAEDRGALVDAALNEIHQTLPRLPMDEVRRDIVAQEKSLPSSIGDRIALPHAMVAGLTSPICALVKPSHPIDWDAPDGEPVDVVLILLSPAGDHERHLTMLAAIARRLARPELREALRQRPVTDWVAVLRAHADSSTIDSAA